jgi:hypothetical protein
MFRDYRTEELRMKFKDQHDGLSLALRTQRGA